MRDKSNGVGEKPLKSSGLVAAGGEFECRRWSFTSCATVQILEMSGRKF